MHWLDDARPATPAPVRHRPQRRRRPSGFLQPGLARVGSLVGEWSAEVDFHAGGFVDQDLRARGDRTIRVGADGQLLSVETELRGWMGRTPAHAALAAAPEGGLRMYVVDAFAPGCQRYRGQQMTLDTLVFEGTATLHRQAGVVRRTLILGTQVHTTTVVFLAEGRTRRLITSRFRRRRP